jgi:hypothetical protein
MPFTNKSLFEAVSVAQLDDFSPEVEKRILGSFCNNISDITVHLPSYSSLVESILRRCGGKMEHIRIYYERSATWTHIGALLSSIEPSRIITLELDIGAWEPLEQFVEKNSFPRLKSIFVPSSCLDTPEKLVSLSKKLGKIDTLGVDLKFDRDRYRFSGVIAFVSRLVKLSDPSANRIKYLHLNVYEREESARGILKRLIPNFETSVTALRNGGDATRRWESWIEVSFPSLRASNIRICSATILEAVVLEYRDRMPGLFFDSEPNIYFDSFLPLVERFHGSAFHLRAHSLLVWLPSVVPLFNRDALRFYGFILQKLEELMLPSSRTLLYQLALNLQNAGPWEPVNPDIHAVKRRLASLFGRTAPKDHPPHMSLLRSAPSFIPIFLQDEEYCARWGPDLFPAGLNLQDLTSLRRYSIKPFLMSPHVNMFAPCSYWSHLRRRKHHGATILAALLRWKRARWLFEGETVIELFEARFSDIAANSSVLETLIEFTPFIKLMEESERFRTIIAQLVPAVSTLLNGRFLKHLIASSNLFILEECIRIRLQLAHPTPLPQDVVDLLSDKVWLAAVELRMPEQTIQIIFDCVLGYFPCLPPWISDMALGLKNYPLKNPDRREIVRSLLRDIM